MLVTKPPGTLRIVGSAMRKAFKSNEIRLALETGALETAVQYDYTPSSDPDKAAYQEMDFRDRAWRDLLLAATGRAKMSRHLLESRDILQPKPGQPACLRVRILTVAAARNLQHAGYRLEHS